MLKTIKDGKLWMVTQPDHGQLAGYLAAHWGGHADFNRPGYYASVNQQRLRDETIFAIAQHDNGWWEWEAAPDLSAADGMPLDLAEVLQDQAAGMSRWRQGLSRFNHSPYANLLISSHAYWIYAIRALSNPDPAFTHPLFWKGSPEKLYPGSREELGRLHRPVKRGPRKLGGEGGVHGRAGGWHLRLAKRSHHA